MTDKDIRERRPNICIIGVSEEDNQSSKKKKKNPKKTKTLMVW